MTTDKHTDRLPELLSPAGSYAALEAAIAAGADAVYFGTRSYNARMNAANFTDDEVIKACALCHAHGVRAYITLNTQLYDREISPVNKDDDGLLARADFLYKSGADALIVADLGIAALIKSRFPDFELHASTQSSGHAASSADFLKKLGFSRMVCARELAKSDVETLVKSSGMEIEMFVHGAYCVSYSGQCHMSWAMGDGERSGNRGGCAQPCRLPYFVGAPTVAPFGAKTGEYPLSLKDMSLAEHIPAVIEMGVSSLKIEGRMKSPAYVYGVTKIYRTLLDQRRSAAPAEMKELAAYFSRSGFTDGYFADKIDASMLGIRSGADKEDTRNVASVEIAEIVPEKIPVEITVSVKKNAPVSMSMTSVSVPNAKSVEVTGDVPLIAVTAPLSESDIIKNISKLGATPFTAVSITVDADDDVILPLSRLNSLRRAACDAMVAVKRKIQPAPEITVGINASAEKAHDKTVMKTAEFECEAQITESAERYFDVRFIPVDRYKPGSRANAVSLPPVIADSETAEIAALLKSARKNGIDSVLVSNAGHIALCEECGFAMIHSSYRLNVFNSYTAQVLAQTALTSYTVSPELTIARMRDIGAGAAKSVIVYGKLPLMYTQRCIINSKCPRTKQLQCHAEITDRTGARMYVSGSFGHRNIIYNSVPVYMADKADKLETIGTGIHHFIFSNETSNECDGVIKAYIEKAPSAKKIRRING